MVSVTLWKAQTGLHKSGKALVKEWTAQRECETHTADKWLEIFKAAEPDSEFVLATNKPKSKKIR